MVNQVSLYKKDDYHKFLPCGDHVYNSDCTKPQNLSTELVTGILPSKMDVWVPKIMIWQNGKQWGEEK